MTESKRVTRQTKIAAIGYALMYGSMLLAASSSVHVSSGHVMFMIIQPIVAVAVLTGVNSVTSHGSDLIAWLAAYMFLSLGLLLTVCLNCRC